MPQTQTLGYLCNEIIPKGTSSGVRTIDIGPHPLDVGVRLEELGRLEDGWLDGDGKALPQEGLQWLFESFERYFLDHTPLPYICPTEDGGVCLEWSLATMNFSLEIDLHNHSGYWHTLNDLENTSVEKEIDLNLPESWRWFCGQIKQGGVL